MHGHECEWRESASWRQRVSVAPEARALTRSTVAALVACVEATQRRGVQVHLWYQLKLAVEQKAEAVHFLQLVAHAWVLSSRELH